MTPQRYRAAQGQSGLFLLVERERRALAKAPAPGEGSRPAGLTLRQGLSVWAPSRLNPFPGWNWPPTAKAMRVE